MKLIDKAKMHGNDLEALRAQLEIISTQTQSCQIKTDKIQLLSRMSEFDAEDGVFMFLAPKAQAVYASDCRSELLTIGRVADAKLDAKNVPSELKDEMEDGKNMAVLDGGKAIFVSENFINDLLSRYGLNGDGCRTASARRDALLQELMGKAPAEVTVVLRNDEEGNYSKAFACRSARYAVVPQTILTDFIDNITGMGEKHCVYWDMTNFMTTVLVDFPDIAKDYSQTLALKEEVVPGVILNTSDTGHSSVSIKAMFRVGSRAYLPVGDNVRRKHYGRVCKNALTEKVRDEIFKGYRQFPERLVELMDIEVVPGEAFELAIRSMEPNRLFIHDDEVRRVIDEMTALYPVIKMPAYEVAITAMYACEHPGLSKTAKDHLQEIGWKAVYAPFESIAISK